MRLFLAVLLLLAWTSGSSQAQPEPARSDTVYQLDGIVVIGTRVKDARKDLPASVSVVSGPILESSATVGDAVSSQVPGAFVTQRGL